MLLWMCETPRVEFGGLGQTGSCHGEADPPIGLGAAIEEICHLTDQTGSPGDLLIRFATNHKAAVSKKKAGRKAFCAPANIMCR
jgi:hypothetical protein